MNDLELERNLMAIAHSEAIRHPSVKASHAYLLARERYEAARRDTSFSATHYHKGSGNHYQMLSTPFRWQPEWDRPAVLYRSQREPDLLVGRFRDVFDDKFYSVEGDGK